MISLTKIFLILILCCQIIGQKVIFTDKVITLHSVKHLNRDYMIERQIDEIIDLIIEESEKTKLEQKGSALAELLRSLKDDWIEKNDMLFNRKKRGIPFLGRIIHQLTDLPGPDQFKAIQILTKKLLRLSKNENAKLNNVKSLIKHDHSEMEKIIGIVAKEISAMANLTNQVESEDKLMMKNSRIDTLNARGLMILAHIKDETEKKIEIFDKAVMNLPSKYLFPPEKIIGILKENSMNDKIHAPIFFTSHEIHELYHFQSCVTAYDHLKKEVQSVLDIPIADYSNSLKTIEVPVFGKKDLDKINSLEMISRLKIDRILCSSKSNVIRFLAFDNLKTCQRHLQKNFYVCLDRQIQMKYDQIIDCNNITDLPHVLVIEKSERSFFILNSNETMTIYCNNKIDRILNPDPGPVNLIIPNECSLRSNSLEIGIGIDHNDRNISNKEVEINFHKIKLNTWSPFRGDHGKMKINENENETDVIDDLDNYDEDINEDLESADADNKEKYSEMEISALAIGIIAMIIGFFAFQYLLRRKTKQGVDCICSYDHSLANTNEQRICKLQKDYDELIKKRRANNEKTETLLKEYESKADDSEVGQAILRLLRTIKLD